MLEPLAGALGISLPELLAGQAIENANRASNLLRSRVRVCPVCGNAIFSKGDCPISCCGIALPVLEAEEASGEHAARIEETEGEFYVSLDHPMTKQHSISFLAYVTMDRLEIKALSPEGNAEARFFRRGWGRLYFYCNRHGLFCQELR